MFAAKAATPTRLLWAKRTSLPEHRFSSARYLLDGRAQHSSHHDRREGQAVARHLAPHQSVPGSYAWIGCVIIVAAQEKAAARLPTETLWARRVGEAGRAESR
jgi:hypothetical protein